MSQIQWAERYRTGIPFIDAQHQELFRSVARVQEVIQSNGDPEAIRELMEGLLSRLQTHFRDEEAVLERLGYPDLLTHASEHASLARELQEMLDRFQGVPASGAALAATFLSGWLRHHISGEDFQYLAFLREHGIAPEQVGD
ncbi:MAG: hemerythrin family protein [Acidobacteria bacterium]|nr:hemerythrin family protein [Acidobacteriota bacterium]